LFRGYTFTALPPAIPDYCPPGQKFIFYVREAQDKATDEYLTRYNNVFNVIMSFKLDADVLYPYVPFCTLNKTKYQRILADPNENRKVNEKIRKKTGLLGS